MNEKVVTVAKSLLNGAKKKAPTLMSIGAVLCFGATIFFALDAQPKVKEDIAEAKGKIEDIVQEMGEEEGKTEIKKVKIECVKKVGKHSIWAVITGTATIVLIFGADRVHVGRTADALAVAEIYDKASKRYKESAKEVVGEKKEEEIRERAAEKRIDETYTNDVYIHETGKGNVKYLDAWTGTYFKSSKSALEAAANKVNNKLLYGNEVYVSMNEFYQELGLPPTKFGKKNGWCVDTGLLELNFTAGELPDGNHCIMIDYDISKDYRDTNKVGWRV